MVGIGLRLRFCDSKPGAVDSSNSVIILRVEEVLLCKLTGWSTLVENDCGQQPVRAVLFALHFMLPFRVLHKAHVSL